MGGFFIRSVTTIAIANTKSSDSALAQLSMLPVASPGSQLDRTSRLGGERGKVWNWRVSPDAVRPGEGLLTLMSEVNGRGSNQLFLPTGGFGIS